MIILYVSILVGYIWLCIRSSKEMKRDKAILMAMAYELDSMIPYKKGYRERREQIKQLHSILHDHDKIHKLEEEERIQTLELLLKVVLIGTVMASMMYIKETTSIYLEEGNQIFRNGYLSNMSQIPIIATIGEERYEFPVMVSEQKYTEEEVNELYNQYEQVLYEAMLGENTSGDYVTNDLVFQTSIEGYPFINEWTSTNYNLIRRSGEVNPEIEDSKGQVVTIEVLSTYHDYEKQFIFELCVYPRELSEESSLIEKLQRMIDITNVAEQEEMYITLPATYEEEVIQWNYQQENSNYMLFLLTIVAGSCIYMQRKKNLQIALKNREEQMILDYGLLINQLILYLGAGMTMRKSFIKIANDYQESGKDPPRYINEEIYNLSQELESGVSESEAYENLGRRCNNRIYLKFGTLLSQNVRKGSGELIYTLKNEMIQAQEERKSRIKIQAEQATTKLLIPMVMMLGIVMIMILVPAFLSFQI